MEEQVEKKPEPKKGEKSLTEELNKVASANSSAKVIPTGIVTPPEPEPTEPKKDGRGRPRKVATEEEKPKGEKLFITPIVNDTLLPLAAKKYKKKREDLRFNEAEITLLNGLQPPIYSEQASWPAYAITAISLLIFKFYVAETEKIESEIEAIKKQMEDFKNAGATTTVKSRTGDNLSGSEGKRENADNKKVGRK